MVNQYRRHSTDHPLDERVAILLEAASAPTEPGPLPGEDEAMAAFRASHESSRRSSMLSSLKSTKAAAAAALSVGVMLTGGAAVAGTLPGAAQETAHSVLAELGIEVPGSDGNHAEPADTRGASGEDEVEESSDEISDEEAAGVSDEEETLDTAENGDGDEAGAQGEHGALVSGFATSTELRGAEKGAAIAALASEGKSKAGENPSEERSAGRAGGDGDEAEDDQGSRGAPEQSERGRSADAPPVETPNKGAASEDAPPAETPNNGGPENGDDASGGKSSGGSENGGRP